MGGFIHSLSVDLINMFCLLRRIKPADKPLLSIHTCHVLCQRYDIPEVDRHIFPIELEIMEERRKAMDIKTE